MPGVFLSYAREDGEPRAAELRERLASDAPDISVKQDRLLLEGGVGWWKQITQAIDAVEFLVLLMTPAALGSGNVQKEWRYARQQGVCVYPVIAATHGQLNFAGMPRWMSKAHFFDLEKEWPTFVAHLRSGCHSPRVPFMAPDLPPHFVARPAEFEALKNLLLSRDGRPVAITTALSGAGGFGKTTLAAALCHDEDIVRNFDDGILWVTLGQTPDLPGSLMSLYAALTGERPAFSGIEDAAFQLGQKLEERTCLLVIDDVWDAEHLRPFLRGGKSSARLFTTRDAGLASKAAPVNVDEMNPAEAASMLVRGIDGLDAHEARDLARRLGEWPLALELAGAMIRERIRLGDSVSRAAGRLRSILDRKGVSALEDPGATERHRTISSVLEVSLDLLNAEDRERLNQLAIFPEDVAIPLAAAAAIWRIDDFDSEDVARRLARLGLLKLDLQSGTVRLHDVMRSWLASQLGPFATDIHARLVDAWADWRNLPDMYGDYALRFLPWHMAAIGRKEELEQTLWDPVWMLRKLKATDTIALLADYELVSESLGIKLLKGALRLSAHVLAKDPDQFASQMIGRLLPYRDGNLIEQFIHAAEAAAPPQPWLRPLRPALHPPFTELVRTLAGHDGWVEAVALTPDGKRAVSASTDRTLIVWDVESGAMLRRLEGHIGAVNTVAIARDGVHTVSGSMDNTVRLWDAESGQLLRTLEGHSSWVSSVAITRDGKRALSGSGDGTLRLWDLDTGAVLFSAAAHVGWVTALSMWPDGTRALSGSSDGTLKLWDFESGLPPRLFTGDRSGIMALAATPDGARVLSASGDCCLTIWNPQTGTPILKLKGHPENVTSIALTADGTRVISGSVDNTLEVRDAATGQALRTLAGHSASVQGVAISADGKRAVSASWDGTLKVWDLTDTSYKGPSIGDAHASRIAGLAVIPERRWVLSASWDKSIKIWDLNQGRVIGELGEHSQEIAGIAATRDGGTIVSASWDNTLKVWKNGSGAEPTVLEGHTGSVVAVALTADGKRAVSASDDKTIGVWDTETAALICTLTGHSAEVTAVAVAANGERAVSTSVDGTLKVWNLSDGTVESTLEGHAGIVNAVALTPDSRFAISGSNDATLIVWDLESRRASRTLKGHSLPVRAIAVSPDGANAISVAEDKELIVWQIRTGDILTRFYADSVLYCCVWVDGESIAAGDKTGRLHLLQLL